MYPLKGPSKPITTEMVKKAINKNVLWESSGSCGYYRDGMIRELIENIISVNRIPSEWQESHIVSVYKGKDDALNRSNYIFGVN